MIEVYTGTKAARPTVLILLSAGVLVLVLGLAWLQVRGTRALGGEVAVRDTPLVVRPPHGWVQSSKDPGVFVKLVRKHVWGREVWTAERKLEFRYNEYLLQLMRLFQAAAVSVAEPARIAKWDGVQYVLREQRSQSEAGIVYRWAATPWGDHISVEYTPLAEISHGDIYLLDAVCEAVRVNGSGLGNEPEETLAHAGVSFPVSPQWEVLGPEDLDGPGLCVQKVDAGRPVWALAVFRRQLPREREPLRLLLDEARQISAGWGQPAGGLRPDGAYVAMVRHSQAGRGGSALASLWVVVKSPVEAAVIYVLADPQHLEAANEAAAELAGTLDFVSAYPR